MDTSSKINFDWSHLHLDALPEITRKAFLKCIETPFFSEQGWYLAGGTALVLQAGHRKSVDLDFFTPLKSFDEKKAEETLSTVSNWRTTSIDRATVYGEFDGAKMSLISYPFFQIAKPFLKIKNVSVVTPPDIAAMKITAISQRGKKRDFFDLYWLSINTQPLFESIESAQNQYNVKQNINHILKSLVYFEDANDDPEPEIFFDANWEKVKSFFNKEIPIITKKLLGLD